MSMAQASTFTDSALSDKVKEFLTRFKDRDGNYKYVDAIDEMMPKNAKYIIVDYNDLVIEPQIEIIFSQDPDRLFDAFGRAIKEALQTRFPEYAEKIKDEVRVRLINFPLERSLRQITAETIGKITSVSGMVVRASEVKPLAKELVFVCPDEHKTKVIQLKGMDVKMPIVCDNPSCKHRDFELKPEDSKFIDFQILRLQELPEDLPPGQLPHYIDVTTRQDLVDNSRPGDRIILTGVVRVEQEAVAGVQRGHSGLYRLRIEGNNIEFLSGRGSKTDRKIGREEISPEEEKLIKSLSQSSDVYQRLIDSFAPHIQGQALIKEAILLLIVGSNQRLLGDGSKIRGDINVFLVGDPGTAKSEMLKFCARIAPRGLYTSGRGSTAAGLTAAVVRDKTGIMMLEAGAVVLGDQGLVSIDEFDKMI
jgi:replicative DNA helicase Mcm